MDLLKKKRLLTEVDNANTLCFKMNLKGFLLNLCLLFIIVSNSYSQNNIDSIIYWSNNKKLIWENFKGKIPSPAIAKNDIAKTSTKISVFFEIDDGDLNLQVLVYFQIKKSWTKDTSSIELLNHEQGHFDISEIYARKIRKYFQHINDPINENLISTKIDQLLTEADLYQDKYDLETQHGKLIIKQKEWAIRISDELNNLAEYEINYMENKAEE